MPGIRLIWARWRAQQISPSFYLIEKIGGAGRDRTGA